MLTRLCIFCLVQGNGVSPFLFTAVIGTPVETVRASISLVFIFTDRIAKILLKTLERKRKKTQKNCFIGEE